MDAAPPTPPNPVKATGHAAKGAKSALTGHSKWVYIAGVTVLIGVAYMVWRKGQSNAPPANTDATAMDPNTGYWPDATQGAFGGYSDPGYLDPSVTAPTDAPAPAATPTPTPAGVTINLGYPAPATGMDGAPGASAPLDTTTTIASSPTGGGTQQPRTVAAHWTPPPAGVYGGVSYNAQGAPLSTPTVASVLATGSLKGTNWDLNTETAPPGFPHKGPHGWYRIEQGGGSHKGHQVHVYQNGMKVYI